MQSWQHYQQKIKLLSWVNKLKIAGVILLVVCILAQAKFLLNWLNRAPAELENHNGFQQTDWEGDQQINLFINPDLVIGYDPIESELHYFRLDQKIELSALSVLAKQTKVYLDGYLILSQDMQNLDLFASNLVKGLVSRNLKTNLTRWQICKLWWKLRAGYTKQAQTDQYLPETQIYNEALKISVLNGTKVGGLALESAVWVEHLGAEVIEVRNADQQITQTQIEIFIEQENSLRTVERLEQIFHVQSINRFPAQPQKEDIRITIGKDFITQN